MNRPAAVGLRPWEEPIWKPARGQTQTLLFLVVVHVLAIAGLILYPIPSLSTLGYAIALACLGGFGTTVCYHRSLAHRTVKLAASGARTDSDILRHLQRVGRAVELGRVPSSSSLTC
jgi:fatty-acid desaturase